MPTSVPSTPDNRVATETSSNYSGLAAEKVSLSQPTSSHSNKRNAKLTFPQNKIDQATTQVNTLLTLEIIGIRSHPGFYQAKKIAKILQEIKPHSTVVKEKALFPCEYEEECQIRMQFSPQFAKAEVDGVSIFLNGDYIGNHIDFQLWAEEINEAFPTAFLKDTDKFKVLAEEAMSQYVKEHQCTLAFIDVSFTNDTEVLKHRIVFELYRQICPKTTQNFLQLLQGVKLGQDQISYVNTVFHRVIPNGWIQGGDTENKWGSGGVSSFGAVFEDENFILHHDQAGILSMVNSGPHTNQSQFMITLKAIPYFDYKYVSFGRVVEGMKVVRKIEASPLVNERPAHDIKIVNAGVLFDCTEQATK